MTRAAALVWLAAPALAAWAALVGGFGTRSLAAVAIAVVVAIRRRVAAAALVAWLALAPLLAGVPGAPPSAWPGLLLGGVQQLTVVSAAPVGHDPWPLAAALLLAGSAWIAGAAVEQGGTAFTFAVVPWAAALALGPPDAAVWEGGAVVLGALLWRVRARGAIVASIALALASAVTAQAVAPRHRWFDLPGAARPRFHSLATEPTFGPLQARRTGAPMLDVQSAAPHLWRAQALDTFDGAGWRVGPPGPPLPQPAAKPVRIHVRVRGLSDALVVSPGRIERVDGPGEPQTAAGEAWIISPRPQPGDTYDVRAGVVSPSTAQLRLAPPPRDPRLRGYTLLGWPRRTARLIRVGSITLPFPRENRAPGLPVATPLWGEPAGARARDAIDRTPYRGVAALARRLAAGARSEWEVVARVQRYLLDGDRFRYTTDVPAPGRHPLVDFLLRTHAGYCQHFAGAAALLLRLAGVPARMVAGFATGIRKGGGYEVRDVDAHAWIEVYFQGYGWVPFNPTPAADAATIPSELDRLATAAPRGAHGGPPTLVLAAIAIAAGLFAAVRHARRRDLGDALARLAAPAPATTLSELRADLALRLGPHTAALAAELERARFAPGAPALPRRRSVARALARDVGVWRAAVLLARRR
jgi:transglutaminase-like putative cysteine protease